MYEGANPLPLKVRKKFYIQEILCSDPEAISYVNDRAWGVIRVKRVKEEWEFETDWLLRDMKRQLHYTDPTNPIYYRLKADIEAKERERDERRAAERRAREEEWRQMMINADEDTFRAKLAEMEAMEMGRYYLRYYEAYLIGLEKGFLDFDPDLARRHVDYWKRQQDLYYGNRKVENEIRRTIFNLMTRYNNLSPVPLFNTYMYSYDLPPFKNYL